MIVVAGLIYVAVSQQVASNVGTRMADEGQTHVADGAAVTYRSYPPASGSHYPAPAAWGSIGATLPEGRYLHNLEHGGIALLYKCAAPCDAVTNQVQSLLRQLPPDSRFREVKVVATPYDRMDRAFAVLAWDYVTQMDTLDTAYVQRFYQAHVNRGPELAP